MDIFDQLKAQMRGTPSNPIPNDAIIIDVRSAGEFSMGHIEGALNIPVEAITPQTVSSLSNKEQTIVVYCASGMRSAYARNALMQMGYTHVINGGNALETAQLTGKSIV